jgi:hypothetical protein
MRYRQIQCTVTPLLRGHPYPWRVTMRGLYQPHLTKGIPSPASGLTSAVKSMRSTVITQRVCTVFTCILIQPPPSRGQPYTGPLTDRTVYCLPRQVSLYVDYISLLSLITRPRSLRRALSCLRTWDRLPYVARSCLPFSLSLCGCAVRGSAMGRSPFEAVLSFTTFILSEISSQLNQARRLKTWRLERFKSHSKINAYQ